MNLNELSEHVKPFDLFKDTLIRYSDVIISGKLEYYLFEMHHIVSDGFTLQNSLNELLNGIKVEKRVSFWSALEYLSGKEKQSIEASAKFINNLINAVSSNFVIPKQEKTIQKHYVFDEACVGILRQYVQDNSLSMQASLSSLIVNSLGECQYIEEQEKIIVGTPVNLRNCVELENTYGPLIQMMPFIVTPGVNVEAMIETKIAINDTLKNKFLPYDYIVGKYGANLFELVITAFKKYDNLSSDEYNQNVAIYPDKFGSTMFIYEGNNEIELVLSSYYLTEEMMDNMINKVISNIKDLGKVKENEK